MCVCVCECSLTLKFCLTKSFFIRNFCRFHFIGSIVLISIFVCVWLLFLSRFHFTVCVCVCSIFVVLLTLLMITTVHLVLHFRFVILFHWIWYFNVFHFDFEFRFFLDSRLTQFFFSFPTVRYCYSYLFGVSRGITTLRFIRSFVLSFFLLCVFFFVLYILFLIRLARETYKCRWRWNERRQRD